MNTAISTHTTPHRDVLPDQRDALADAGQRAVLPGGTAHLLSRHELEVVSLVARGLSNRTIAAQLRISERTVEVHLAHARDKLDLDSRVKLVAWVAAEAGTRTD